MKERQTFAETEREELRHKRCVKRCHPTERKDKENATLK